MSLDNNKPVTPTTTEEEDRISRSVLVWLNSFPDKPVQIIDYGALEADAPCMALTVVQSAITERDILGGHRAEYQFGVLYRVKPGSSPDKRLVADELLNQLGSWASSQKPDLGEGIKVQHVETTARAALTGYYSDNGDENHQILMKITYEVI